MALIMLSLFFVCLLILFVALLMVSPDKIKPYYNSSGDPLAGRIAEKVFVMIGDVKQGMFIKGKDVNNPVLLFVHGGSAFPEYFLVDKFPAGLENNFTVCYWEQRGGGLSYSSSIPLESMTFQQLASDAIAVTNYLRKRFGVQKIYVMAHSGGTAFTIQAVALAPKLYYAYIGIGQITQQSESEKLAYAYMMKRYTANGNTAALEKLKQYPILESESYIIPFYKSAIRDHAMHDLGIGTMRNMKSVFWDIFIPVWTRKAYTIKEKINIWRSKFSFIKKTKLIDQLFNTDITSKVTALEVPVYFFSGKYDLTVNHDLSEKYLSKLQAPIKGFYTFNVSAHSPIFEEPIRLKEIMINDVLNGTVTLSDRQSD